MKNTKNDLEILSKYRFARLFTLEALEKAIKDLEEPGENPDIFDICRHSLEDLKDAYSAIRQDRY